MTNLVAKPPVTAPKGTRAHFLFRRTSSTQTSGRDDTNADKYRYPYEATPYCVFERLAGTGTIGKDDTILDYGCGKGRVGFFFPYRTKAKSIGIEYDERI